MKILQTENYDLFVPNPLQREFRPKHVIVLAHRMKAEGFKPSSPISVSRLPGGKLQNNTGHHRVPAAKIAGVPVFYVIEHPWSINEIVAEGVTSKQWGLADAASAFSESGHKDYGVLQQYVNRGIPLRMAASMLRGEHAASGNAGEIIKDGRFKIKPSGLAHMEAVCQAVESLSPVASEAKSMVFISALSAFLLVPEFSLDQMIRKIKLYPRDLIKSKTRDQMMELMEELYNRQSRIKHPISFMAKSALNDRNPKKKK